MRILIVGLNFPPELISTGKYTGELAAYLAASGHAVRVITTPPYYPHWKIRDGYHAWRYTKEAWQGVEIQRCPLWVPRKPTGFTRLIHLASFALSSLPALAAQLSWKPSVVICVAPALMSAPFALVFARLSGAQAWIHVQDFELDAALKLGIFPVGKRLADFAARFESSFLNSFDHLSTISQRMLTRLHEKGISPHKTSLFPNWVDTNLIYPLMAENPLRTMLGIPDEKLIVLYAGTMGKKQGLENLLIAARRLRDQTQIQFILCGDGAVRAELEAAAQGLPNVRFLPVQPIEKLNQLLNLADIHVLPQRANAADLVMPSKLSGMLASGKAVIATADPQTELGQIVGEVGCLIQPDNADVLAAAILDLAASTKKRIELGKKGREYAVSHWGSTTVLTQFENCLRELAGRKH
ncbi:MAG: glycosyltransferase WbuB [Chloroflexi bacterium]|nr:glycosyltransferase WbuB [Chloroflexota bacterium]